MNRALLPVALLLGGLVLSTGDCCPARAAESAALTYFGRAPALPFPRWERAQSVWASGACWSDCGAHCAWGLAACLARDAQGRCLKLGDACDRYCQRQCRASGGPLVSDIFDAWE